MKRFSIVGTGRLGTALAAALAGRGWEPVVLADRNAAAARAARRLAGSGRASSDARNAGKRGEPVIIAVPDDELGRTAQAMAGGGRVWDGKTVLHTSGLLASSALEPLRRKGASAASAHPVQSFPSKEARDGAFRGIFWAVEGDPEASQAARDMISDLGGNVLAVSAADKPTVHLACSLASNALTVLQGAAISLLGGTGLDERLAWEVLAPLVEGTLANIGRSGPAKALSGPAVRGDLGTIKRHLEVLKDRPLEKGIYLACLKAALELIPEGSLPPAKLRALKRLAGRK